MMLNPFFGFLRQEGGRNDTPNTLAATNAITKVLETGIISKGGDISKTGIISDIIIHQLLIMFCQQLILRMTKIA